MRDCRFCGKAQKQLYRHEKQCRLKFEEILEKQRLLYEKINALKDQIRSLLPTKKLNQYHYDAETVVCHDNTCPACGQSTANKSACIRHLKTCKYITVARMKLCVETLTKLLAEQTKKMTETKPYIVLQNASLKVWLPNDEVPWQHVDGKHPLFKDYYGSRKVICRKTTPHSSEELEYAMDEVQNVLQEKTPRYKRADNKPRGTPYSQTHQYSPCRYIRRRPQQYLCHDCKHDKNKCGLQCPRLQRDCDRMKLAKSHWFDGNCSLCKLKPCSVCGMKQTLCAGNCERRRDLCIGKGSQFPQRYHDKGTCRYAKCDLRDPAIWCAKCNKSKEQCGTGCERLQEICDELNRAGHGDWHEYHCKACQQKICSECGKSCKDCLGQCPRREKRCLQLQQDCSGKFHEARTCKYMLCSYRDPDELKSLCASEKDPFHRRCHCCITKACQICGKKRGVCEKDCKRLKIVCEQVANDTPGNTHCSCRYEQFEVRKTRKRKREEADRKCKRTREMQDNAWSGRSRKRVDSCNN